MSTDTVTATITNSEQIDVCGLLVGTIAAVIVFLVGYFFTKYGKRKAISRAGESLKWLAVAILGVSLFVCIAAIRDVLLALTSIAAVIIALLSFDQSRRIRQDSLDKENRDRKEQLLNEIIKWVNEIILIVPRSFYASSNKTSLVEIAFIFRSLSKGTGVSLIRSIKSKFSESTYKTQLMRKMGKAVNYLIKYSEEIEKNNELKSSKNKELATILFEVIRVSTFIKLGV